MKFIFLSRLALFTEVRKDDRINFLCKYWNEVASKFYENQTKQFEFEVYLDYDDAYKDIVLSYNYPKWAVVSTTRDWIRNWSHLNGKDVVFNRIDVDDMYSNDFCEYMDNIIDRKDRMFILHKYYIQYLYAENLTSEVMYCDSPHFASVYVPNFKFEGNWGRPLLQNHTKYSKEVHESTNICVSLETIQDINSGRGISGNTCNKWIAQYPTSIKDRRFSY